MKSKALLFLLSVIWIAVPALGAGVESSVSDEFMKARDPFRSPPLGGRKAEKKSDLEVHPLDAFKMTGVLTGPDHLRAMVQLSDGKTFLVSERMKIGVHQGFIKRITPDGILVREKMTNILGQDEFVDSEIPLSGEKTKELEGVSQVAPATRGGLPPLSVPSMQQEQQMSQGTSAPTPP